MAFSFAQDLDSFLVGSLRLRDERREEVRKRLNQEMVAQGLRNVELSELTGWSTSKVSKISAGKQKLTDTDIRTWARALGYTPEPFLTDAYDIRAYKLSQHVRNITDSLLAFLDDSDDLERGAIINYELPLAILATLGLRVSDYSVRTCIGHSGIDPVSKKYCRTATSIRFWNRTTKLQNQVTPELGMWIDPNEEILGIILYLNSCVAEDELSMLRLKVKEALASQKFTNQEKSGGEYEEWLTSFWEDSREWMPRQVIEGEISSSVTVMVPLEDPESMAHIWGEFFRDYCDAVWQVNGIDILPEYFKTVIDSPLASYELYNLMMGHAEFESAVRTKVLEENEHACEIDGGHKTFCADNGYQYMEVVPLVPFVQGAAYGKAILSSANALCLCPTCRAQLVHGRREEREDMLIQLFKRHKEQMLEAGIDISLSDLLKLHQL